MRSSLSSYLVVGLVFSFALLPEAYCQSYNRSPHGQVYPDYSQGGYNRSGQGQIYPDYSKGGYNRSDHGQIYPDYSKPNKPYYGYQRYNNTPYGFAGFGRPVPFGYGRDYYTVTSPTATYRFWKAPSGYYYPWYNYQGVTPQFGFGAFSFNQGSLEAPKPAISVVYQDLGKFLQQAKSEGKLNETDYAQLNRRLNDLISKTNSVRFQEGGTLSDGSEEDLRADFDKLSQEVSFRLR